MPNNLQAKKLKSYFLHLTRGFTVVELLVVIGIIAIMSVIVMGSISNSKKRGRDYKRIADISVLQLAFENYYVINKAYPTSLSSLASWDSSVPTQDPLNVAYLYSCSSGCQSYHLGTELELTNGILDDDSDSTDGFSGTDPVYDVVPKY